MGLAEVGYGRGGIPSPFCRPWKARKLKLISDLVRSLETGMPPDLSSQRPASSTRPGSQLMLSVSGRMRGGLSLLFIMFSLFPALLYQSFLGNPMLMISSQ